MKKEHVRLSEVDRAHLEALVAKGNLGVRIYKRALGLLELDANRYREAEPVLRRALKLAPKSSVVHLAMGRCMTLAGKPDEARRFMDQFASLEIEEKRPWRVPPKP